MNALLSMLKDDTGAVSSMRVILLLVALAVLVPHVVLAIKTSTTPQFSASDLELLGLALGAKLLQNGQEASPAPPPATGKPL